jgi:sigma-B regulation protein RsbQ
MMDRNFIAWAHFMAPMVMKNLERPELTATLEASFCSTDPRIARRFAEVTFLSDNRLDLPHVEVPTLIMQCADDTIAPSSVGDYVHQHVRGSVLRRLRATGHCPQISHPHETIRVIKEYLGCTTP